jgi:hypothetical protein
MVEYRSTCLAGLVQNGRFRTISNNVYIYAKVFIAIMFGVDSVGDEKCYQVRILKIVKKCGRYGGPRIISLPC